MSEEIQEAVEKFLNKNGNKKYTNNQLIIYALEKIDRLPCLKHMTIIENSATTIKNFKWFAGILISMNFTLIGGILFMLIA